MVKTVYFSEKEGSYEFLSNWYVSGMFLDGERFSCVGQYVLYCKALLFKNYDIARGILEAESLVEIKSLERKIAKADEGIWSKYRYDIVKRGISAKFMCNEVLMRKFLDIPLGSIFVDCSLCDKVWGIGIDLSDDRRLDEKNWKGFNLLGKVLTEVRMEAEEW